MCTIKAHGRDCMKFLNITHGKYLIHYTSGCYILPDEAVERSLPKND